jgi:hypothetical protein
MNWGDLIKDLGIFAIASGFISWIIKLYIQKSFDKDLEKFKSTLEKEIIQFRIKYERLHSERAEVIKEVYKRIVKAYHDIKLYKSQLELPGFPSGEERKKILIKTVVDLIYYYEQNRIFFEEELAGKIDDLIGILGSSLIPILNSKKGYIDDKKFNEIWGKIDKEAPEIKKIIEKKFREIIGIQ